MRQCVASTLHFHVDVPCTFPTTLPHTYTCTSKPKGPTSWLTNITVRECSFNRTVRGVRIKTVANSTAGPGCHGHVTNLLYKDLAMTDVNTSISIIMQVQPLRLCCLSNSRTLLRAPPHTGGTAHARNPATALYRPKLRALLLNLCADVHAFLMAACIEGTTRAQTQNLHRNAGQILTRRRCKLTLPLTT